MKVFRELSTRSGRKRRKPVCQGLVKGCDVEVGGSSAFTHAHSSRGVVI